MIRLYASVPVATFRRPRAREFRSSYRMPPFSTVYGMLLSFIGEEDSGAYEGTELALAYDPDVHVSRVLRQVWQFKGKGKGIRPDGYNRNVDYQEVVTGTRLSIWLQGELERPVEEQLNGTVQDRWGPLYLGESSNLIDQLREWRPKTDPQDLEMLCRDPGGELNLPVWPDHIQVRDARFGQFSTSPVPEELPPDAWVEISQP